MRTPGILHYGTLRSGIHLFQLKELGYSVCLDPHIKISIPMVFPSPVCGSSSWQLSLLITEPLRLEKPTKIESNHQPHTTTFTKCPQVPHPGLPGTSPGMGPHHPAKHPLPMPEHHCHGEALPVSNLNLPCCCLRQTSQGVQPSQHFLPPQL